MKRAVQLLARSIAPLAAFALLSPPSTAQSNLFRIAGTVVNAASGAPLRHATVSILAEEDGHTIAAVESGDDGHFSFNNLPAAKYQLTASKRGFRTAFYDEHDEFNSAIVAGPDLETGDLTLRLVPGASLHGVVLTEGGDPVENARVMLFLKAHDGRPGMRIHQADSAATDDTGAYEFDNLAAGEYRLVVVAEPWYALHRSSKRQAAQSFSVDGNRRSDQMSTLDVAYPITYFDSTTDEASATPLVLAGGSREEADINLHAVPALRIQVDTPRKPDGSTARAELRQTVYGEVVGAESAGFLDATQSENTEFTGVAPGHYQLVQGDPPRIVELDAVANQQIDPALGAAAGSVRGTLRDSTGAPFGDDCSVTLEPLDPGQHQTSIQTPCIRGAFLFSSAPPGEWLLSIAAPAGDLPITSISAGGHARRGNQLTVPDRSISAAVTVAQDATELTGFARRDGKGVSGLLIVLVPSDMASLESLGRRDQSDSDGSFSLRNVIPGKYTLTAIEDGWTLDWANPQAIARYLPGGIPVTVSEKSGKLTRLSDPVPVQMR